MNPLDIEQIAKTCHEANRVYCESMHDYTQVPWDVAPDWVRASALAGVTARIANPLMSAAQQHQAWCEFKQQDGWVWGATKDPVLKTHPCLVPYDELPHGQRFKDELFGAIVASFLPAPETQAEPVAPISAGR